MYLKGRAGRLEKVACCGSWLWEVGLGEHEGWMSRHLTGLLAYEEKLLRVFSMGDGMASAQDFFLCLLWP